MQKSFGTFLWQNRVALPVQDASAASTNRLRQHQHQQRCDPRVAVREVTPGVSNSAEAKVSLFQKPSAAGRMTAAPRIVSRIIGEDKQTTREPKTQTNTISGTRNCTSGTKTKETEKLKQHEHKNQ